MLKEKLSQTVYKRLLIILFAAVEFIIVLLSMKDLGYSPKENEIIAVRGTEAGQIEVTADYNYQTMVVLSKDIILKKISIAYCASEEDFSGVLAFSVTGNGGESIFSDSFVLDKTSDDIEIRAFDIAKYLLKGESYSINCRITVNGGVLHISTANLQDLLEGIFQTRTDGDSVFSGYEYQVLEMMRWNDVFRFMVPVSLVLFIFMLIRVNDVRLNPESDKWLYRIIYFFKKYYSELFLIGMFIYFALYVFYYAYCADIYISPDSSYYLRAADSILQGNGFYYMAHSGDSSSWFATWPIGYPFLIACTAFVFHRNVYLASKILSVILVGIILVLLHLNFRKNAWMYSFCLVNLGFLSIYKYTWSENPFILAFIIFALVLAKISMGSHIKKRWYIFLSLSCISAFLMRYFGIVSVIIAAVFLLGVITLYLLVPGFNTAEIRNKMIGVFLAEAASTAVTCSYLYMNYRMAGSFMGQGRTAWWDDYYQLTKNLYDALLQEICNALCLVMPATVLLKDINVKAVIVLLFMGTILYFGWKKAAKFDDRFVFIWTGILYDAIFIIVRFHSSMDEFGYRFFAPGSLLIVVGIIGFLKDGINRHIRVVYPIAISILVICIGTLTLNCRKYNTSNTAYAEFVAQIQAEYDSVPSESLILGFQGDYRLFGIRTDINYTSETISTTDEIEDVFNRYAERKYISISNEALKGIVIGNPQLYTKSVVDFFMPHIGADTPDSGYTTIFVKDRRIMD